MFIKIHKTGLKYFFISLFFGIITYPIYDIISYFIFILTIYIYYFFRDPIRIIPEEEGILSPADGKVIFAGKSKLPDELMSDEIVNKVSIFMNIFNVHVNRIPYDGVIKDIKYIEGSFFNASLDKSSKKNERNIVTIKNKKNEKIIFVQIAGLIARRIVCDLKINQKVNRGSKFGIIKFGSRVDIYLPKDYNLLVQINQKVKAGETIISNKYISTGSYL